MSDETIFDEARGIVSNADRAAFLDVACRGDRELRKRVETLLEADEQADSFFDEPIIQNTTDEFATSIEKPGQLVGPYKLLQQVGEGGFGVVYLAEQQEPVHRRVALKVIKPGMDSRQVIARFEAERQALAMMDHPNIAMVLDAGMTSNGRPYFVMELVKGLPIIQFCDEQKLSPRERLKLFIPVCNAIQHAHQKGVIHRDIKPTNILVSLYDGQPVPKVIDFGVAKAIQHRLTNKTVFTQFGQVIGTLEYMSPEQAEMNQLDIDTRSDIYSLGAVLYELLAGTTPLDQQRLRNAAFDEMLRIIREEEPLRPSVRLSSAESLPSISAQRRVEPGKLTRMVHGELDWIVMKALDKQRSRRYATATSLGQDIQRYLDDEPIEARSPSASYRIRKFARKNRGSLAIASTVFVLLAVATIVSSTQSMRATVAERRQFGFRKQAERIAEVASNRYRESNALRLAVYSELLRNERPVRSLLLAVESVSATRDHGLPVASSAHSSLLHALGNVGGIPLVGHTDRVTQVKISPNGNWLATASMDGSIMVRDLLRENPSESGLRLTASDSVTVLSISPDSRWLAGCSTEGAIYVWDLNSANPEASLCTLKGHLGASQSACFSHDSKWLASACEGDGSVRVWDLTSVNPDQPLFALQGAVSTLGQVLCFGPNRRWLFTGDRFKMTINSKTGKAHKSAAARLWDLSSPVLGSTAVDLPWHGTGANVWHSPDGRWLVSAGEDVQIRDLSSDDPSAPVRVIDSSGAFWFTFSKDSRWVAFVSGTFGDKHLQLCDLERSDRPVTTMHRGADQIQARAVSSRWLAANINSQAHIFDLTSSDPAASVKAMPKQEEGVEYCELSPDERWLITGSSVNGVRVWDLTQENRSATPILLQAHDGALSRTPAISPNSRWLVTTAGKEPVVRLWDLERESRTSSFTEFPNVTCFGGGRYLVSITMGAPSKVRRIDLKSSDLFPRVVELEAKDLEFRDASITADGRWFLTSGAKGVAVFDFEARPPRRVFHDLVPGSSAFSLSAEGRWLSTVVHDEDSKLGAVRVWDLRATDEAKSVVTLPDKIEPGFGADERWLVVHQEGENAIEFWGLAESPPQRVHRFVHDCRLTGRGLSTGGNWAVTLTSDNVVRTWDLRKDQVEACTETQLNGSAKNVRDLSANGRWLVTAASHRDAESADVTVWDLHRDHSAVPTISITTNRDGGYVWRGRISEDGRYLVTGTDDGVMRVWDLASATPTRPKLEMRPRDGSIGRIYFTEDQEHVVFGGNPGVSYVCDLNAERAIALAMKLAGRRLSADERTTYRLSDPLSNGVGK